MIQRARQVHTGYQCIFLEKSEYETSIFILT